MHFSFYPAFNPQVAQNELVVENHFCPELFSSCFKMILGSGLLCLDVKHFFPPMSQFLYLFFFFSFFRRSVVLTTWYLSTLSITVLGPK